jgi:hypothetical protein
LLSAFSFFPTSYSPLPTSQRLVTDAKGTELALGRMGLRGAWRKREGHLRLQSTQRLSMKRQASRASCQFIASGPAGAPEWGSQDYQNIGAEGGHAGKDLHGRDAGEEPQDSRPANEIAKQAVTSRRPRTFSSDSVFGPYAVGGAMLCVESACLCGRYSGLCPAPEEGGPEPGY